MYKKTLKYKQTTDLKFRKKKSDVQNGCMATEIADNISCFELLYLASARSTMSTL